MVAPERRQAMRRPVAAKTGHRIVGVRRMLLGAVTVLLAAIGMLATSGCSDPSQPSHSPSPILTSPLPDSGSPISTGAPLPTATKPPGALSVGAFGAAADGSTDDTAAVLDAARAATSKGVAVWFPRGTYAVGDLTLPRGAALAGAGADGAWLKGRVTFGGDGRVSDLRVGRDGAATRFSDGAANMVFRSVTFVGGGGMDSGEDQGVIRFSAARSAADIRFVACVIDANSANGNGVSMVSNGRAGATYRDITWQRCLFKGSPRMNIEVIQRSDGSGLMNTGYSHIDLLDCAFDPSGSESVSYDAVGAAGECTISGCTFYGAGWNDAYPYGQGIEFNGATRMRFVGNTVYRCRGSMINHSGSVGVDAGTIIKDNVFDGTRTFIKAVPSRAAQTIYFSGVDGAVFSGNVVRTNVGGELAYLAESSNNRFSDNSWTDVRSNGQAYACVLITDSSSSNAFIGDRFETAAGATAVYVRKGSQGTVFRSCVFVLPASGRAASASAVAADPGLTVTRMGDEVRQ